MLLTLCLIIFYPSIAIFQASQVAQCQRTYLPTQETWLQSLGWEDSLEKEMATHSSILTWEIPCMEEHGGVQSMEWQRVRQDLATENPLMHTWSLQIKLNIQNLKNRNI